MGDNAIIRQRGDTLIKEEITVIDCDTGEARDITGASFLLTVDPERDPVDATNNLFQIVGTVADVSTGEVEFELTDDMADNLGNYYFDAQMTIGGKPETVMKDTWTFKQDITK